MSALCFLHLSLPTASHICLSYEMGCLYLLGPDVLSREEVLLTYPENSIKCCPKPRTSFEAHSSLPSDSKQEQKMNANWWPILLEWPLKLGQLWLSHNRFLSRSGFEGNTQKTRTFAPFYPLMKSWSNFLANTIPFMTLNSYEWESWLRCTGIL